MNSYKACKIITDLKPIVDVAVSYLIAYECVLMMLEVRPTGCTEEELKKIRSFSMLPETYAKNILIDIIREGHVEKVGDKYLFVEDFGQPINQKGKTL